MNHIGVLEVNFKMLEKFLGFPVTTKMLKVRQSWEQERSGVFEILVEDQKLSSVLEGDAIPWVRGTLTAEFCTQDEITHLKDFKVENY